MTWAFPKERLASSYILDCDDWNANVSAWAAETDGNLNEHNFNAPTTLVDVMDQAADDIAMRILHHKEEVSPTASGGTDGFAVPHAVNWSPIADEDGEIGTEFASPGGKCLVLFSFQLNNPSAEGASGLMFCIELDGAPMMNSLLGTGDESNDYTNPFPGIGQEYDFDTGPSMRCDAKGYMIKGSYTLTPGLHKIRILARNLYMLDATVAQYVSNRELIILHLWA